MGGGIILYGFLGTIAAKLAHHFVKSVLDHKASVHAEEHRAFADSDERLFALASLAADESQGGRAEQGPLPGNAKGHGFALHVGGRS